MRRTFYKIRKGISRSTVKVISYLLAYSHVQFIFLLPNMWVLIPSLIKVIIL